LEVGVLPPGGFSFRKLQIVTSQTTDFHFVSLHFVSQITVSPNPRACHWYAIKGKGSPAVSACTGCCFNFVEYIAVKKKNVLTNSEGKQTGFLAGIEPSTIGSMRLLLTTRS